MKTKNKRIELKIRNGNKKIPKDTLILNITSATSCPSKARGLCEHPGICYAMKAERLYPACRPFRDAQTKQWDKLKVNDFVAAILAIPAVVKGKIKYLRFSESGDFRSQKDVDKLNAIAKHLQAAGIKVYGYTARRDLDFSGVCYTVNGANFMVSNNFYVVPEYTKADKYRCAGNCSVCNLCKMTRGVNVAVKKH